LAGLATDRRDVDDTAVREGFMDLGVEGRFLSHAF
jgi:hypothetical protein